MIKKLKQYHLSLKGRFMLSMTVLVIVLIGLITFAILWSEMKALYGLSEGVSVLAQRLQDQQAARLNDVEKKQVAAASSALETKTKSLLTLLAKLALVPLLTFDIDVLDEYGEQVCNDPDVVLFYVTDANGEVVTHFRNEKDRFVQTAVSEESRGSVAEVSEALKATEGILEVGMDVLQDDEVVGRTVLMVSNANVMRQVAEVKGEYGALRKHTKKIFASLQDNVEEQIARESNRGIMLGAVAGGAALSLTVLVVFLIVRSITRPLSKGVDFAKKMSRGDFTHKLEIDQQDEIGTLADALNHMVSNLGQMFKDIATGVETLTSSSAELSSISQQMSAGSQQTSSKSNTVSSAADEMSSNIGSVAAAMEEASMNVNMVAAAVEQMTATIIEIAQNAEKACVITGEAVSETKSASESVNQLGNAAQEIGKVTETITEISDQTNLLALNATIEAARAGEAGKGFAVVANEIKELARQTAEATHEIKKKIDGIQSSTDGTVTEIEQISKIINGVNEIVSTIATAVEEQSVTTREIAGNVAQVSQGIQDVNENVAQSSSVSGDIAKDISEVNQAANEMTNSCSQVNLSADELSKLAEQLNEMVQRFKV
jgi:methyl-accepting chemotaxis protein